MAGYAPPTDSMDFVEDKSKVFHQALNDAIFVTNAYRKSLHQNSITFESDSLWPENSGYSIYLDYARSCYCLMYGHRELRLPVDLVYGLPRDARL
ncbi:hypothetical protein T08_9565 [Trichinella sp. T8]|nr:hypothetical protein T08_9565 [Trichinella sp. T8]